MDRKFKWLCVDKVAKFAAADIVTRDFLIELISKKESKKIRETKRNLTSEKRAQKQTSDACMRFILTCNFIKRGFTGLLALSSRKVLLISLLH